MYCLAWIVPARVFIPLTLTALVAFGQENFFRSDVNEVVLSLVVKDSSGRYVRDLKADDIRILEDGVEQRISEFTPVLPVVSGEGFRSRSIAAEDTRNHVFVLVDTSNCMYSNFPYEIDAVADFIRRLPASTNVAVYPFSRNLTRATTLTRDRNRQIAALYRGVLGDDTALYNAILLAVRDAAKVPGSKTIVVFSNGPDNASIVSPDDVARAAQEEGVTVHIVGTEVRDQITHAACARLTSRTGGSFHIAADWTQRNAALAEIDEDLRHSWIVSYHALPNPNMGFRRITVEILGRDGARYRVQTRPGYYPRRDRQDLQVSGPVRAPWDGETAGN